MKKQLADEVFKKKIINQQIIFIFENILHCWFVSSTISTIAKVLVIKLIIRP